MLTAHHYPRIVVYPPGPKTRKLIDRDYKVTSPSLERDLPLSISSAEDLYVIDIDGNRYIDLTSGFLTMNLSHKHPNVVKAIKDRTEKLLSYPYNRFYNKETIELSEELIKLFPGKSRSRVLLTVSMEDALEAGLKMSLWNTRRHSFATHIGSYHGQTIAALSLTSDKARRRLHIPTPINVIHIPYPYCYRCPLNRLRNDCREFDCLYMFLENLEKVTPPQNLAAFLLNPIQVRNGVIIPPEGYIAKLFSFLKENGILLIVNEGLTSLGRTASWLAINHWNIEPDGIILGDNLASGLPLSALVASEEFMDWYPGSHSTISGGNPLSVSAALATITTIRKKNLISNANKEGLYMRRRLNEIGESMPSLGEVRSIGLLSGVEIIKDEETRKPAKKTASKIVEECWKKGLLIETCGESTILLAPPINVNRDDIDLALDILESAIKET